MDEEPCIPLDPMGISLDLVLFWVLKSKDGKKLNSCLLGLGLEWCWGIRSSTLWLKWEEG